MIDKLYQDGENIKWLLGWQWLWAFLSVVTFKTWRLTMELLQDILAFIWQETSRPGIPTPGHLVSSGESKRIIPKGWLCGPSNRLLLKRNAWCCPARQLCSCLKFLWMNLIPSMGCGGPVCLFVQQSLRCRLGLALDIEAGCKKSLSCLEFVWEKVHLAYICTYVYN